MVSKLRKYLKDESGVALMEAAFSLLVLMSILTGMIEISSFLRVKDKVNKVSEQIGEIVSTVPRWHLNAAEDINNVMASAELMARPFGIQVSVAFCHGASGISDTFGVDTATYGDASCTIGFEASGAGNVDVASCDDAQLNERPLHEERPAQQYVVVKSGCKFKPYMNYAGLFDEMVVESMSVAHMRNHMAWYIEIEDEEEE